MVKIVSNSGAPIGSTVALVSLCNHLHAAGHDCVLYAPDHWYADKCRSGRPEDFRPEKGDAVVVHGINLYATSELDNLPQLLKDNRCDGWRQVLRKMKCRRFVRAKPPTDYRLILTCQEGDVARSGRKVSLYHGIHFLDEQWKLRGLKGQSSFVCPNPVDNLKPSASKPARTAGIIGTIRRRNAIEKSIVDACDDGMEKVIIFGRLADPPYYYHDVRPIVESYGRRVQFAGFIDDKQRLYDSISDAYSSSGDLWSPVRREAAMTATNFHGRERTASAPITNEEIITLWTGALDLRP